MNESTVERAYLSAGEQIKRFRDGSLSPVGVLDAQIERYDEVGERINAVTDRYFAEARAAAREAENRYRAGNARALEGVTSALKDEDGLAGWRVTSGSVLLKGWRAATSARVTCSMTSVAWAAGQGGAASASDSASGLSTLTAPRS